MDTTNTGSVDLLSAVSVLTGEPSGRPREPQVGRALSTCVHCAAACPAGDTACVSCEQIDVIRCSSLGLSEYAVTYGYTSRPGTTEADDVTVTVRYVNNGDEHYCVGSVAEHVAVQLADWLQTRKEAA